MNLNIIPFRFKHLEHLIEMHKAQKYMNLSTIDMSTLPKVGYIAYLNDQPIAAGFLRRLEPHFAQIDTLVSNPYFGSQIRHEGVKAVVNELIEEAKRLKLKGIISLTSDLGVLKRAEELNFHVVDQKVIALNLD